MTAAAPFIVTDVWKYGVFHYLDFRKQARCTRVCRLWNQILHELQYEYGRVKALRALNNITPLNLPLPSRGEFNFEDCKDAYILFSTGQRALKKLWLADVHTQQLQEVGQNAETSLTHLCAARWISKDKFVSVVDGPNDLSFEAAVWQVAQREGAYQITKITEELFDKEGRLSSEGVLSLENRVFMNWITDQQEFISYFNLKTRLKRHLLLLDVQGAEMRIKKVTGPSSSLRDTFASHRDKIFALDYPGLSAYQLTKEGTALLAWKKSGVSFLRRVAANDQWFVATSSEKLSDLPATHTTREMVTFHVFDILEGKEVFVFTQSFARDLKFYSDFMWLSGNFLIILVGCELRTFHIPTKSHLASISIGDSLANPQLIYSTNCPIHLVQIDQQVLRIVYEHKNEDNSLRLKIHEISLVNQLGSNSLALPQIQPPPPAPPPIPSKWEKFKNLIYIILTLPVRFVRWIGSLFII